MSEIYSASSSAFYSTYKLYKNYIGYTKPYSYRSWMRLPEKYKAAALYVQFYNEITLAWYKVKTQWSIEEEGVECINQYLMKNVTKISNDRKRFSPKYIYKVAYNCLYCVCIDPSKNKDRYYNETSSEFDAGDETLSWFDFISDDSDFDSQFEAESLEKFFDNIPDALIDICIQYELGEITAKQAASALKKLKFISGNLFDKEYVSYVVKYLKLYSAIKLSQSDEFEELARELDLNIPQFEIITNLQKGYTSIKIF